MSFRKHGKTKSAHPQRSVSELSVGDLSALYQDQRSSLVSQARRILYSDSDANEVVQEAFLRFILAAPELDSKERALAYLRRTVNNLSFNVLRAKNLRPSLYSVDTLATQSELDTIALESHISLDDNLIAAEDAAIIREALSRLSPHQRTALVMWEMEGRDTNEIAEAIGTTPENVRHVVSRSRSSFVKILSSWVIDEETGLTALESLSSSYKKFGKLATKSSTVAVAFTFMFATLFGFNSLNNTSYSAKHNGKIVIANSDNGINQNQNQNVTLPAKESPKVTLPLKPHYYPASPRLSTNIYGQVKNRSVDAKLEFLAPTVDAKIPLITYAGVDANGIPNGFTVTDLNGNTGTLIMGNPTPTVNSNGITLDAPVMSYDSKAVNVLLTQKIVVTGNGTTYTVSPSVSIKGNWVALNVSAVSTDIQRLPDGDYLVSTIMITPSQVDVSVSLPTSKGIDVSSIPTSISAKILLNNAKTKILAETVKVNAIGVSK